MEYYEESVLKQQKAINKKINKIYRRYKNEVPEELHNNLKMIVVGVGQLMCYKLSREETSKIAYGVQYNIDCIQETLNNIISAIEENNLYREE